MNIAELINQYEIIIKESKEYRGGETAQRICIIYINVIFYLIEKDNLKMSDDYYDFKKYLSRYSPHDLYKVAEYRRRSKGLPPLNYKKQYYQREGALSS